MSMIGVSYVKTKTKEKLILKQILPQDKWIEFYKSVFFEK